MKDHTVITLCPEDMFRLNAILLDEDRDAALDFLAAVIKKKADAANKPHCRPIFELETRPDAGIYQRPTKYGEASMK